jgi:hypothetical protein
VQHAILPACARQVGVSEITVEDSQTTEVGPSQHGAHRSYVFQCQVTQFEMRKIGSAQIDVLHGLSAVLRSPEP